MEPKVTTKVLPVDAAQGETMRAVFWDGKPFEVSVRSMPKPKISNATDAIVRITTAGICGSDLHTYHGLLGGQKVPWVLGHEAIGIVVEVGPALKDVKLGDRVILGFPDKARFEEEPSLNLSLGLWGFGSDFGDEGPLDGLQAEYARVPNADLSCIQIPYGIPDQEYIFIGDIFATGWTALDYAGFQAGDSVAIFGAGPVGLLCAYSAMLRGAARVFSIDHVQARLDLAESIGAVPIDFTKDGGPAAQILKLEPNGLQRVCDCVGYECVNEELNPQQNYIINEAVKLAAVNAGIGVIGLYMAQSASEGTPLAGTISPDIMFPMTQWWTKGINMKGGLVQMSVIPHLLELVKLGRARPGFVVSREISIEDAPVGYKRFSNQKETKVLIRFLSEDDP